MLDFQNGAFPKVPRSRVVTGPAAPMTIRYAMKGKEPGTFTHCQTMIPADMEIQPGLQKLYEFVLKRIPTVRSLVGPNGEANFLLLNRSERVVGYLSVDIGRVSDADVARVACFLVEFEGVVIDYLDPSNKHSVFAQV